MTIDDGKKLREIGRKLLNNQKSFVLNNIMRTREMLRYGSRGFRTVFQTVPYLLQVNLPTTPGFVASKQPAMGIYGFERSGFARMFMEANPDRELKELFVLHPRIQSLMLIGSAGSIGHTQISDLDYWVCVNRKDLPPGDLDFLQEKLQLIQRWAWLKHKTEAHFFLMDLEDIRMNRLGDFEGESSGDLMPRLVKEEFYRTSLHVVGRMPLWWLTPTGITQAQYRAVSASLEKMALTTLHPDDIMDLGCPEPPKPLEYLGAAMWQAHKSQKDPFKAVLKMMLILEQVENRLEAPLLCNQVKEAILSSSADDLPIDPYLISIKRVLAYARESLELVRFSALFKMHAPLHKALTDQADPKSKIMEELRDEWGWKSEKLEDLFNYRHWSEKRKLDLGEEIKALLLELFSRIAARLRADYPEEVVVQSDSMAMLSAQILARYTSHKTKVEELPSAFHRYSFPRDLSIAFEKYEWKIHDSSLPGEAVFKAERAARIAMWLVHNSLWNNDLTIRLADIAYPIKKSAFLALFHVLDRIFPPFDMNSIKGKGLLSKPQGPMVVIINMEEPNHETRIIDAEIVYRSNIGEMFHETLLSLQGNEEDKYRRVAERILEIDDSDFRLVEIFSPPGQAEEFIKEKLSRFFKNYKKAPVKAAPVETKKVKLDTD